MRHSSWFHPSLVLLPLLFGLTTTHAAPLGTAFTHKGEYRPGGTAVTGVYDFQIVLFNVATVGAAISTVTRDNVVVTQGNFTVEIDYGAPPFATATQYWLETRVRLGTSTGAFTVLPVRQKLNAVPYALNVRTLPPGIVTGASIAPNAVGPAAILDNSIAATDIGTNAVGLTEINALQVQTRVSGICAPGLSMRAIAQNGAVTCDAGGTNAWRLLGNAGTNPLSHFLGTTDNQPLNMRVNNQRVLRLEPNAISPNVIGGNAANFVNLGVRGATISGGGVPSGDTDPVFFDGGPNGVTDAYGTIAGGYNNQAGDSAGTVTDRSFSTVGGGRLNTASGNNSTVAGGYYNTASGDASTVAGGRENTAEGDFSTVAGGRENMASGLASFTAGSFANAIHSNSFVWNGWTSGTASSLRPNSVQLHGENGLSIESCARRADGGGTCWVLIGPALGHAISTSTGARLTTGGVWTNNSDKHRKTAFAPIDPQQVLAKVVALPVTTWQYKAEAETVRHLGPMAQDFHAAFQLGADDKTIATLDTAGVALAAIQGLNRKLEKENATLKAKSAKLEAKSAKLEAENTEIKARLTALEKQTATHARTQTRLEVLEARFEPLFQARAGE